MTKIFCLALVLQLIIAIVGKHLVTCKDKFDAPSLNSIFRNQYEKPQANYI